MTLTHLDAQSTSRDEILEVIDRDAAVILEDALTPNQVESILGLAKAWDPGRMERSRQRHCDVPEVDAGDLHSSAVTR